MTLGQCSRIQSRRSACWVLACWSASSLSAMLVFGDSEEVLDDLALIGWCLGEQFVQFVESLSGVGDTDSCRPWRCGRGSLGEPVAGRERVVHVGAPLVEESRFIRDRSVAGDVVGELVAVAPGGECAQVVVVDDRSGRVGGAVAGPPGQPIGWCATQLVEHLSVRVARSPPGLVCWFVRIDAVVVEGAVPGGEVVVECGRRVR